MQMKVDYNTKPKGLENVGATCYMNAVLQCFYHVKILTNELLPLFTKMPMTSAYKDVLYQLSSNSNSPAKPLAFKNVISANPLFRGIQANDSKDLILYFLENIENELTIQNYFCQNPKYINRIRNMINIEDPALMNIINVFQNTHKSIISDLFYGFRRQSIECSVCQQTLINYQIFNLLIFPIEVVYNNKKNNSMEQKDNFYGRRNKMYTSNQTYGSFYDGYSGASKSHNYNYNYNYNNNYYSKSGEKSVTLEECFENEISDTNFYGENQIFCNNCRKMCNAKGVSKIFSSPYILILILNRGKGNEFDCDVDFKEKINIKKYVDSNDCPNEYELIGVISHLGESSMNGHFIADCKHFDGKWYSFSDSSVTLTNRYTKRGMPYILFYQYSGIQ